MENNPSPVRLDADPSDRLSRWLWLVKWVLLIPQWIVLACLWFVYAILTFVAWWAILFTGRYPRGIFDFNVGVLRWAWRVQYYGYSALATDRYPPFTFDETPDYPARLTVEYPGQLSRGLIFVKWLLAIPHLIIVSLLVGGTRTVVARIGENSEIEYNSPGIIGLLALVAGILLLFTGKYPEGLWRLLMALNRWVFRTWAYVGLMTDQYPPFRLDMGGREPFDPVGGPTGPQDRVGGPQGGPGWPQGGPGWPQDSVPPRPAP